MANVKLIHSVDKPNNLRTLLKQDLKELGVKVPKLAKKPKKLNQSRNSAQDGFTRSNIFGNYLCFLPSRYVSDCGFVPNFLVDAAEIIEKECQVEGIFRKSGSVSRQKELKQQVEDGKGLLGGSVHDVTGLVKQFFRELPEPLFISTLHDSFVKCYSLITPNQVDALMLLCLLLPVEHLCTLRFIMGLLARIAAHSFQNKMDVYNLAVVMAPNIMHVNSRSQKMNSAEEKLLQIQTSIVELLIHNAKDVGVISESLVQRLSLMTEFFGTEDELEASDDNTLDDEKGSKDEKKKRRKRSSSLQGLASSIGRGIARLRRHSEGKTSTTSGSSESLSSENDFVSQSQSLADKQEESSLPVPQPSATPIVLRKRKIVEEVVPFSASKKKAILDQLPNKSALGTTPFTPASCKKHQHRGNKGFNCTSCKVTPQPVLMVSPEANSKGICKTLNLFSPSSSKKSNRCKPGGNGNFCSNQLRKSGKAKQFFKRLSGGKNKDKDDDTMESITSPTEASHCESAIEIRDNERSVLAFSQTNSSSSFLHETSATSTQFHDRNSALNQGFIAADISTYLQTTTTSQADGDRGQTWHYTNMSLLSQGPVRHSSSTDGALRRGQPNMLSNGLLEGKAENLRRLRRSFDKSDINQPTPVVVPILPENYEKEVSVTPLQSEPRYSIMVTADEVNCSSKKASGVRCSDFENSLLNVVLSPPLGFSDQSVMVSNKDDTGEKDSQSENESESGFSTISGGTVIPNPAAGTNRTSSTMVYYGSSASISAAPPSLCLQSSMNAESLISTGLESSVAGSTLKKKVLDRSTSIDSGKGSLLDNADEGAFSHHLHTLSLKADVLNTSSSKLLNAGITETSSSSNRISGCTKSRSAEDLKSKTKMEKPRTRSHSMSIASSRRHSGGVPNLQISAETHRLLRRAGFLDDSLPPDVKDVAVPFISPKKNEICQSLGQEERLVRSFRLERSSFMRKNRSTNLQTDKVSPVKEESSIDQAEMPANHSSSIRRAEQKQQEVWVRQPHKNALLEEPATKLNEKSVEKFHEPFINLKHAERRMQKHDSIMHIKDSNAGNVAQNVHYINSLQHFTKEISDNSALHFQKCTSRRRGASPVRIPTIFAKRQNGSTAAYYRELAEKALRKEHGVKSDGGSTIAENESEQDPERNPENGMSGNLPATNNALFIKSTQVLKQENTESKSLATSDLSSPLRETIDVITPRRQKLGNQFREAAQSPLCESTNTMLYNSAALDNLKLRTSKGLTPHQIGRLGAKTSSTDRSPAKPVKRLKSPRSSCDQISPSKHSSQKSRISSQSLESSQFHECY